MKNTHSTVFLAMALWMTGATFPLHGADEPASGASKPNRDELREQFKNKTPEERSAALKEWREKHPEAAAKMKEAQQRRANVKELTPVEREERLKERRNAAEARVASLQKKKAAGTISDQESQQLLRLEQILKAHPPGQGQGPSGANKGDSNPGGSEPATKK